MSNGLSRYFRQTEVLADKNVLSMLDVGEKQMGRSREDWSRGSDADTVNHLSMKKSMRAIYIYIYMYTYYMYIYIYIYIHTCDLDIDVNIWICCSYCFLMMMMMMMMIIIIIIMIIRMTR